jgi:NAD-dependent dihydropyrimidine dehydrogenase PreA subunit
MTYVITEPCVDCVEGSCLAVCPVDCIYSVGRMYYIHPDECVTCGACEYACPVEAIFHEDDVPAEMTHYTAMNAELARQTC